MVACLEENGEISPLFPSSSSSNCKKGLSFGLFLAVLVHDGLSDCGLMDQTILRSGSLFHGIQPGKLVKVDVASLHNELNVPSGCHSTADLLFSFTIMSIDTVSEHYAPVDPDYLVDVSLCIQQL
ncbi:uncharacterized protein LOC125314452 [Rhodamnia argentea]|uniref:Uncharacterized protein LOC125314452 n=1 Tax=Rhodamnia argentea TaxID=178133 RepID=A0ABM3H807_9MYRT|nr:uncharacterized protein LOC125314452 [Rhodamnia argentea]